MRWLLLSCSSDYYFFFPFFTKRMILYIYGNYTQMNNNHYREAQIEQKKYDCKDDES